MAPAGDTSKKLLPLSAAGALPHSSAGGGASSEPPGLGARANSMHATAPAGAITDRAQPAEVPASSDRLAASSAMGARRMGIDEPLPAPGAPGATSARRVSDTPVDARDEAAACSVNSPVDGSTATAPGGDMEPATMEKTSGRPRSASTNGAAAGRALPLLALTSKKRVSSSRMGGAALLSGSVISTGTMKRSALPGQLASCTSMATSRTLPAGCAAPSADQFAAARTRVALPAGGRATPAAPAGSRRPGAAARGSALASCCTNTNRLVSLAPGSAAREKMTFAGCEPLFAGAAERVHATAPAADLPPSTQPNWAAGRRMAPPASSAGGPLAVPSSSGGFGATGTRVSVAVVTASPLEGSSGSAPGVTSAAPAPASEEPAARARSCSVKATGSLSSAARGPTCTWPLMGSTSRTCAALSLRFVARTVTSTARPSGSAALMGSGSTWPGAAPVGKCKVAACSTGRSAASEGGSAATKTVRLRLKL